MEQSPFGYQSSPGNYINLFKSRKIDTKSAINKTSSNGTSFRITTTNMFNSKTKSSNRNYSPSLNSPFIKKRSLASTTSPEKNFNQNSNRTLYEIKKIVYVNEKTREHLEKGVVDEEEKTFALEIPFVFFKEADTISILPECSLEVVYMFGNVKANRLYIEYEKVESVGLSMDAPILQFSKIRINLTQSSLAGGYAGLFRCLCNS